LVGQYFAAVRSEDVGALTAIATDDATFSLPRGKGSSGNLLDQWRTRFSHLAYRRASRNIPYDDEEIAVYAYEDLTVPPPGGSPFPLSRPLPLDPNEMLVHVPVRDPRGISGDRLFGDDVWLILRRRPLGGLAIRQVIEDFQLP
jgi:hypothetical protein